MQRFILKSKNQITLLSAILIATAYISKWAAGNTEVFTLALIVASVIGALPIAIQAYQALRVKVVSIDLLVTIAVISAFLIQNYEESAIVTFLFLFGAYLEQRTLNQTRSAIKELTEMAPESAFKQMENGEFVEVDVDDVDEGDLLLVKTGAKVPVDGTVIFGDGHINEASITGESLPVGKEKDSKVFAGTILENGTLQIVADRVGEDTTFGRIIELVEEAQDSKSQTERFVDRFSKYYTPVVLFLAFVVWLFTKDVELAITILVLGCPGALVIGVPVSNVAGIGNGARSGVLLKGSEVITDFSRVDTMVFDKTGTLTQNKMTVTKVYLDGEIKNADELSCEKNELFLKGFVLCNDASTADNARIGDPTELALLDMGAFVNVTREGLEETNPRINEQSFDSARKLMTTVHRDLSGNVISCTKGAMDILLERCRKIYLNGQITDINNKHIEEINKAATEMARGALRVLALGIKEDDDSASEENLTFVGLVGMIDPPRPEAKASVKTLKNAGIKTIMITGDHKDTALAIAKELGIAEDENQCITGSQLNELSQEELNERVENIRVFARVSPEHKVMIVKAFKSNGSIVSMTGDGVNDAPSLKAADIGVSMGITGTDVAKGASDMVLTDDNFATIEKAVAEGRGIYKNIKKTVLFLLSSNFGEVISMFSAIAAGLAAPLQSIHILWINLITDSLPALALGVDPKDSEIMNEKPRDPNESLFAHGGLVFTIFNGLMIAALTLGAFLWSPIIHLKEAGMMVTLENIKFMLDQIIMVNGVQYSVIEHAQTYAFTTLGISQLFHAIGMRNYDKSLFRMKHTDNIAMIGAFTAGLLLQVLVTEIPFLTEVFETSQLSLREWMNLILLSAVPLLSHEIIVFGKKLIKK